jgi:alpha-beta hydrolase superfamily lysophospholipase
MKKNTYDIVFRSDGFKLKGRLHLPGTDKPPLVVGSHGLEGSMESAKQKVMANILVRHGIAFFRFDHRGCGRSQGNFETDTSLEKRTEDLVSAVTHVMGLEKTNRKLALFGSSLGGAACINAWHRLKLMEPDIKLCGAVICSAPVRTATIKRIPTGPTDRRPALPLSFFEKNLLFDITPRASELFNVLIFHGDADQTVPVSNALDIHEAAQEPKRLIIHKDGDHQMTSRKDQVEFEKQSIIWLSKCFDGADNLPS